MRISDWSSDVCSSDLLPSPPCSAASATRDDERVLDCRFDNDVCLAIERVGPIGRLSWRTPGTPAVRPTDPLADVLAGRTGHARRLAGRVAEIGRAHV